MSLLDYIRETKAEMRHVSWPTKRQVVIFTITVIAVSALVAVFLGFFDLIFSAALKALIEATRKSAQ